MSKGHHVLWEKRLWNAHDPNKKLREKPGLIVPLEASAHQELHDEVAGISPPCYKLGNAILGIYRDNPDNHLQSVENFMRATQEAISVPRIRPVERMMGQLMIASVEAQRPFIKDGLRYG